MPCSFPPGSEGQRNELNYNHNPNGRNFVAPQCEIVVPACYNYGKAHQLDQAEIGAVEVQPNSWSIKGHVSDRDTEADTSTWGYPEMALNRQNIVAAHGSVPYSCTMISRAPKEVAISKIATISIRPGSQEKQKPKRQCTNAVQTLAQCKGQGSLKEKSLDFEDSENEYNLANAPIFQILCAISKS